MLALNQDPNQGKSLDPVQKWNIFFIFVLAECYHLRLGIWIRIQNILDMLDLDSGFVYDEYKSATGIRKAASIVRRLPL
jgi:hypothetical protein